MDLTNLDSSVSHCVMVFVFQLAEGTVLELQQGSLASSQAMTVGSLA